ncbi:KAP family P-loop domain protein [compost metagenome]
MFFLKDNRRGWAVGDGGSFFSTTDGGASWGEGLPERAVEFGEVFYQRYGREDWLAIGYDEAGEGWLVSRAGLVMRWDGNAGWEEFLILPSALLDVALDPENATLACLWSDGRLRIGRNGGANWSVDSVQVPDAEHIALTGGGIILMTRSGDLYGYSGGDSSLRDMSSLRSPDFRLPIRALEERAGALFLIAERSSIGRQDLQATQDRLQGFRWLTQPPQGLLHDVRIGADGNGTASGHAGQRYLTRDGGRSWAPDGPGYARYPAPWVWLGWLAGFVALGVAALRPPPTPTTGIDETIADAFASDRPLAAVREDRLDFAPRAWGLSAFLRNERTEAPLTIAITGDWGSGKSSLMGLLREDLARFGVRSVWFNAWHHQKEEALLAALLAAIRDQAIPGWLHYEGLIYRLRLLWIRGRRYWLLSLLVAFIIGLLLTYPLSALHGWLALVGDVGRLLLGEAKDAPAEGDLLDHLRTVGLTAGVLAPLVTALLRLRAFGVDPGALVASLSNRASVRDLGVQASFRQRFAVEFGEVTAALEPRNMLVMIDDLDRCRPEAVLEVMEAVNFLVSSGRVFVVLGMARERVEACVGLAFEKVAQEMVGSATAGSHENDAERARQVRREYARQYLEKLINIEVPMPQLDPQASSRLQDEAPPAKGFEWPLWLVRLLHLWPLALLLCVGFLGALLGDWLPTPESREAPAIVAQSPTAPGAPADSTRVTPTGADESAAAYFASASEKLEARALPYGLPLAALTLALLLLAVLRRPDPVVKDSPAFRQALAIWNPVVAAALRTPRAVKRYQNWVRYLAMMQRAGQRAPTLWETLRHSVLRWLGGAEEGAGSGTPSDNSPELVALGALERVLPGGVADEDITVQVGRVAPAELHAQVRHALAAHAAAFEAGRLQDLLPRFRQLTRGVRMEPPPAGGSS